MRKIRKFIRKRHPLRRDVIDMISNLADIYDDRAEVNIAKCEECDSSKQVFAYYFAEGKTYRNSARDLRDLVDTLKII